MNRALRASAAVLVLTPLSACGSETPAEVDAVAASTASASPSVLAAAHAACDPVVMAREFGDSEIVSKNMGVIRMVAGKQNLTLGDFFHSVASQSLTYTPAEDTLVASGAYSQYDSGDLNPVGALAGLMYECAINELGVPERVSSHINSTRALDGTQEDSWNDLHARWTFHPDDGLDMTIWSSSD